MILRAATVALGMAVAALGACTTLGTGSGQLSGGPTKTGGPVIFSWKASDGANSGDMIATLPDGRAFRGPFVQMTRERSVQFDPSWLGWPYGGIDWDWSGAVAPRTAFETTYGGQVVANLEGPGTDRMRCRFTLNEPSFGMAGGGQGQCQLVGGATIDAVFPRA